MNLLTPWGLVAYAITSQRLPNLRYHERLEVVNCGREEASSKVIDGAAKFIALAKLM